MSRLGKPGHADESDVHGVQRDAVSCLGRPTGRTGRHRQAEAGTGTSRGLGLSGAARPTMESTSIRHVRDVPRLSWRLLLHQCQARRERAKVSMSSLSTDSKTAPDCKKSDEYLLDSSTLSTYSNKSYANKRLCLGRVHGPLQLLTAAGCDGLVGT